MCIIKTSTVWSSSYQSNLVQAHTTTPAHRVGVMVPGVEVLDRLISISSSGGEFVSKHCRLPQLLTVLVEGMNTRLWICNPITSLTWLQLKEDPGLWLLWFLAGIRERNYVISSLRWQDYSWHLSTKPSTFIISRSKTSHVFFSSLQQCYSHATGTPSLKRLGQKQEA